MIVHRIPYPPDKGEKIRSFNQLKFLAERGWNVHLCALADDRNDLRHVKELERYCSSVLVEPLHPGLQKVKSLTAPLTGRPMSARYFYNSNLQQRVDELLRSPELGAVLCFCSPMAEYLYRSRVKPLQDLDGRRRMRLVMDLVDIDSDKWQQYAGRSSFPMKWVYAAEGRLLRAYERQVAQEFDATLLVSAAEAEAFRIRTDLKGGIHAVSNGVDLEFFHTAAKEREARPLRISFCGAMSYRPNADAVDWFAREVLPLVREALGEVEFWIVGGGAGDEVKVLAELPGVRVTGRVDDVRPYVWNSDISVAPIRIARGIQNKVLEAMALGVPALVTPLAFEGLEAQAGRDLVVADAVSATFAAAVIALLRDPVRRQEIATAARQVVEANYSWNGRLRLLEELLSMADLTAVTAEAR